MKEYKDWICRYYSEHEDDEEDGVIIQELVRCKDCYFCGTFQRKNYCTKFDHSIKKDGFCAWAERKDG